MLQRQQECIVQLFLLPGHLLFKMHGCCPNEVCLENLTTYLVFSSSIAHKASVLRNLAIIVVFYFVLRLICDWNHFLSTEIILCERFEPRSHFKSRLSLIILVNVVLNRTVVDDSDWRFDNLCGSHLQSQSELYHVSWWNYTLVIGLIGQLRCNVIGRVS